MHSSIFVSLFYFLFHLIRCEIPAASYEEYVGDSVTPGPCFLPGTTSSQGFCPFFGHFIYDFEPAPGKSETREVVYNSLSIPYLRNMLGVAWIRGDADLLTPSLAVALNSTGGPCEGFALDMCRLGTELLLVNYDLSLKDMDQVILSVVAGKEPHFWEFTVNSRGLAAASIDSVPIRPDDPYFGSFIVEAAPFAAADPSTLVPDTFVSYRIDGVRVIEFTAQGHMWRLNSWNDDMPGVTYKANVVREHYETVCSHTSEELCRFSTRAVDVVHGLEYITLEGILFVLDYEIAADLRVQRNEVPLRQFYLSRTLPPTESTAGSPSLSSSSSSTSPAPIMSATESPPVSPTRAELTQSPTALYAAPPPPTGGFNLGPPPPSPLSRQPTPSPGSSSFSTASASVSTATAVSPPSSLSSSPSSFSPITNGGLDNSSDETTTPGSPSLSVFDNFSIEGIDDTPFTQSVPFYSAIGAVGLVLVLCVVGLVVFSLRRTKRRRVDPPKITIDTNSSASVSLSTHGGSGSMSSRSRSNSHSRHRSRNASRSTSRKNLRLSTGPMNASIGSTGSPSGGSHYRNMREAANLQRAKMANQYQPLSLSSSSALSSGSVAQVGHYTSLPAPTGQRGGYELDEIGPQTIYN